MTTQRFLPEHLKYSAPVPENEKYKPWLPSPPSLADLSGDVVNNFPKPECWTWDSRDITIWLTDTIGLPQYQDCFVDNHINGRRLLLIDASACPKIGIRDFSHIQRITKGIRDLYKVEMEKSKRSISLPPRYPWTHYLLYSVFTGPKRDRTTPVQLFRMMGILDEPKPCPFGHWEMINPHSSDFPFNRFGLVKRKNVYVRVEYTRQPRNHSYYKRTQCKPSYFRRIDIK